MPNILDHPATAAQRRGPLDPVLYVTAYNQETTLGATDARPARPHACLLPRSAILSLAAAVLLPLLAACATEIPAHAPVEMSIVDRDSGQALPVYRQGGRGYVAGRQPGTRPSGAAAVPADAPETASKAGAVRTERRTSLAVAILRSGARMVPLLLAHGANRMVPDRQGKSPMDHAIAIQNRAVMRTLQRQ